MARKYELITELYQRTVAGLAAPQEWQRFLTTACRNFRLPFDEQVLIFAQRPDATAVLPIEGRNGWNQRFGRWVNRGATGIAVFDDTQPGRSRLKYYFDISDTHESRFARPVPVWTMRPEFELAVIETLENSFGKLADQTGLAAALLSAAQNAVEDNVPDYLSELKSCRENSFLEELDDLNIEVEYRQVLQDSIGYMLLVRCGIDPSDYFDDAGYLDVNGDGLREKPDGSELSVKVTPQYTSKKQELLNRIADVIIDSLKNVGVSAYMDTESLQSSEIWEANMVDGNYDMNIGYTTSGVAQYRTAFRYFVADVLPDDTENTAGSTWIWGTNHDPKLTEETWGITYAASEAEYLEHVKNLQKMASEDLFAFALCWERAFFPYRTDKYEGFSNWNSWGVINTETWYHVTAK